MPKWIIGMALLALTGCQSQAQREEQKLKMVQQTGDKNAICDQSRKVAAAYLDAGDNNYGQAKLDADVVCTSAAIDAENRALLTN